MSFDRQQFIADLRSLAARGISFRLNGSDPETGLDCVHFPRIAYEMQGLELPIEAREAMEVYSDEPNGWQLLEKMRTKPVTVDRWFGEIPVIDNAIPDALPGDLIVIYVRRNPKHMAVIVNVEPKEPFTVVEAWRSLDRKSGELKEHRLEYRRRIAACFRIPDFD